MNNKREKDQINPEGFYIRVTLWESLYIPWLLKPFPVHYISEPEPESSV